MDALATCPEHLGTAPPDEAWTALEPPRAPPPPNAPAELRAWAFAGDDAAAAWEPALAQLARAAGALDLAIGEGLAALAAGDRLVALGYSCLRDYAREALGLGERKAQAMAQLARELRTRPLLRAAVLAGDVRIRNAQTVLPVARGEAEAGWVERARHETVRALARAVKDALPGAEPDDEEWMRLVVRLSPEDRASVDEALELAGRLLPGSRRPERLEAMAQEYLGAHPGEAGDDGGRAAGAAFHADAAASSRARREALEARLEEESGRWAYLPDVRALAAPSGGIDTLRSARELDARLRELAARRDRWDALLGYLAHAVRATALWRVAGFASFEHYCAERLGLAPRTVEQRAALEARLWQVPALREARDGGLSYEKLRLLARLPDREVPGWVGRARALTCLALRCALERRDEAQMRAARLLRARVPGRVAALLAAAFRAVRLAEDRLLDDGRCLVRVARHFVETWGAAVTPPRTRSEKARARDQHRCQVPGCSKRAVHAHHIVPRSRGGSDEPWNLVALCAVHHLRAIHGGFMRVAGIAPDRLVWTVDGRPFLAGGEAEAGEHAVARAA